MYPNGQPQGNFLVTGLSAPVLIPKRAASSPTRHEWLSLRHILRLIARKIAERKPRNYVALLTAFSRMVEYLSLIHI